MPIVTKNSKLQMIKTIIKKFMLVRNHILVPIVMINSKIRRKNERDSKGGRLDVYILLLDLSYKNGVGYYTSN